jgi:hypothetical protein
MKRQALLPREHVSVTLPNRLLKKVCFYAEKDCRHLETFRLQTSASAL